MIYEIYLYVLQTAGNVIVSSIGQQESCGQSIHQIWERYTIVYIIYYGYTAARFCVITAPVWP